MPCVTATKFPWESFGGRKPPLQKEFPRGPRRMIGQARRSGIRSCVSFAVPIGFDLMMQRFNDSRMRNLAFHQIRTAWGCALMVQS